MRVKDLLRRNVAIKSRNYVLIIVVVIEMSAKPTFYITFTGKAGPSKCGAQCKTWAQGPMQDLGAGPSKQ